MPDVAAPRRPWPPTATMFFVNGAGYGVWATQIPLCKERLALAPSTLGIVLLMVGAGAVMAMAGSGWMMQRAGSARLIRMSGAAFCCLLPLTAIAPDAFLLGATLLALGASGGLMDVAMNAHAADVEQRTGRPMMSSFHGMWSVGGLVGAGIGGVVLAFAGGAVQVGLLAAVLGGLLVWGQRHLLPPHARASDGGRAALKPSAAAVGIGVLAGLAFAGEGAVLDWGSVYLRDELGAMTQVASAGFAAFSGAMALGRFFGDGVRRRFGAAVILRGGCALALAGLLAGPLTGHPGIAVAGFGLAGIGLSNVVPVLFSTAGALRHPETAIATVSTLGYAGLLAAPPFLGFVAQATSLAAAFGVAASLCFTIAVAAGRTTRMTRPAT